MKYITKPVIIEAAQFTIKEFNDGYKKDDPRSKVIQRDNGFFIDTKQREVSVFGGDFIITLEDGESYPCNPTVFKNKYESVDERRLKENMEKGIME